MQVVRYFTTDEEKEKSFTKKKKPHNAKIKTYRVDLKRREFKKERSAATNRKKVVKTANKPNPKFKGRVPIPKEKLEKHSRGDGLQLDRVKTLTHKKKLERKEKNIKFSNEEAARTEILLTEQSG